MKPLREVDNTVKHIKNHFGACIRARPLARGVELYCLFPKEFLNVFNQDFAFKLADAWQQLINESKLTREELYNYHAAPYKTKRNSQGN